MLPDDHKEQVNEFVDHLLQKISEPKQEDVRQFGAFRERITMASDFDAPLEDFKDYM